MPINLLYCQQILPFLNSSRNPCLQAIGFVNRRSGVQIHHCKEASRCQRQDRNGRSNLDTPNGLLSPFLNIPVQFGNDHLGVMRILTDRSQWSTEFFYCHTRCPLHRHRPSTLPRCPTRTSRRASVRQSNRPLFSGPCRSVIDLCYRAAKQGSHPIISSTQWTIEARCLSVGLAAP